MSEDVEDQIEEEVETVAGAVEDWKQAKYFIRRLRAKLFDGDVDYEAFKNEFAQDGELDRELIDLIRRIKDEN